MLPHVQEFIPYVLSRRARHFHDRRQASKWCMNWVRHRTCRFKNKCHFAHHFRELRPMPCIEDVGCRDGFCQYIHSHESKNNLPTQLRQIYALLRHKESQGTSSTRSCRSDTKPIKMSRSHKTSPSKLSRPSCRTNLSRKSLRTPKFSPRSVSHHRISENPLVAYDRENSQGRPLFIPEELSPEFKRTKKSNPFSLNLYTPNRYLFKACRNDCKCRDPGCVGQTGAFQCPRVVV
mmetsp:Transcript_8672/g.16826  ORF Transcript_8672/g.16826 Transcript_8672/m.16826 type:complete len:234 (+) Transcript_8672:42-743(+)